MEVSATKFTRNFPKFQEEAQHEPLVVKNHDRVAGYFISARAFEDYQRLRGKEAMSMAIEQLPDASARALRESRMDERHAELNRLLEQE